MALDKSLRRAEQILARVHFGEVTNAEAIAGVQLLSQKLAAFLMHVGQLEQGGGWQKRLQFIFNVWFLSGAT